MFPTRIYLTGFMGSGKSTIGPRLAGVLGYDFVDLDERITARAGRPVQEIFAEEGEAAFRELEAACLRATAQRERVVVALGGGALTFEENLQFARAHGAVVYLYVPPVHLTRRLQQSRTTRPLLLGKDGRLLPEADLQEKVERLLAQREPFYSRAHCTVHAGSGSIQDAVEAVLSALESRFG